MIRFSSFEVLQLAPRCLTLRWAIENIPTGYDEYLKVYRSESPEGPWEPIGQDITGRETFHDHDAFIYNPMVTSYYKITGMVRQRAFTPPATPLEEPIKPSKVEYLRNKTDAKAAEIIRRQNLLLSRFNGIPGYFLIKRTWGSKCVLCYDKELDKVLTSDCSVCFNTKYSGGYFTAIPSFCSADNTGRAERTVDDGIKVADSRLQLWTTNTPELKKGDIWVDSQGKRWVIEAIVMRSTRLRAVLRQLFIAFEIPANDVVYKVPVPSVFELDRNRDSHIWKTNSTIR